MFLTLTMRLATSPTLTSPKSTVSGVKPMAGLSALSPVPLIMTVWLPPSDWIWREVETLPVLLGEKSIWILLVTPGCTGVPCQFHAATLNPTLSLSSLIEDTVIGLDPELVMEIYSETLSPTTTSLNDNRLGATFNSGAPTLTPLPVNLMDFDPAFVMIFRTSENEPSSEG